MSYDYNALLSKIQNARAAAEKASENAEEQMERRQEAVEAFEELSAHCPMTPLLWMQYALDTSLILKSLTSEGSEDRTYASARIQLLSWGWRNFQDRRFCTYTICSSFRNVLEKDQRSYEKL